MAGASSGAMIDGVVEALLTLTSELREDLDKLGKRLDAVEQVKFLGVWQKQIDYKPGNFVTRSGALWHCDKASKGIAPGSDPAFWTMATKGDRA